MTTPGPRVLFGAAYYHEYQPHPRLRVDLDLMSAARFSVIRVGESVWSTWEPQDGVFDLDWLDPVLDAAAARDISVIVGTPTYAVPPWLRHKYPETAAQRRTGQPIPYGHRQDVDITSPTFRWLAERVIRRIVTRYAAHPAVIGWQLDNEPGNELLHNSAVFTGFVTRLRATYGDVATLNDAWGLTYWSHRISCWSELWTPDGNTVPSYDLAWRRYQAQLTTEFIGWQVQIVRELARPEQFVTTCLSMSRPALDAVAMMAPLDVTAVNAYYPMQDALTVPRAPEPTVGGRPHWIRDSGTWSLYLQADTARGVRQEPFLVTETNATSIGDSHSNYPAFAGQWRQAAWALVARGARMVEYWNWHTLHYGHETYWGGVLGHSLEPARCYAELARVGQELAAAGPAIADLVPDTDVGMLVSAESRWALQFQPPLPVEGGSEADPHSYDRIVGAFYRGLFDAGLQVGIVSPNQLASDVSVLIARFPVLVVPALYVAGDDLVDLLRSYAQAGGHLVLGFRSGYADEEARPRVTVMPGALAETVGARYTEYTNLASPVPVVLSDALGGGSAGARALAWADAVEPNTAEVLAGYDSPHLKAWAAVTTRLLGPGRATYVGTLPDPVLAERLAHWIRSVSLAEDPWFDRPGPVTVTAARTADGRRLHFLSNWSWDAASVTAPWTCRDVLSGARIAPAERISLEPWDVRVLSDSDPTPEVGDTPHREART